MAEPRFYSHESQHEACGEENFKVPSYCRTTGLMPAVWKGFMGLPVITVSQALSLAKAPAEEFLEHLRT